MKDHEAGMTLIEVLVVIAILATLAGMVSVIIGPSREANYRLVCINHQRELVGHSTPVVRRSC